MKHVITKGQFKKLMNEQAKTIVNRQLKKLIKEQFKEENYRTELIDKIKQHVSEDAFNEIDMDNIHELYDFTLFEDGVDIIGRNDSIDDDDENLDDLKYKSEFIPYDEANIELLEYLVDILEPRKKIHTKWSNPS